MPRHSDATPNAPDDGAAAGSAAAAFLDRWRSSGASERANYALFLSELCDVLGVPRPNPSRSDDRDNDYVFERFVTIPEGDGTQTTGRIDLYKKGCFVLEAKQGAAATEADGPGLFGDAERHTQRRGHGIRGTAGWDEAMEKARGQAERYVRALPAAEGNPPFVVVVDVGHTIELYCDFTRLGKTYTPFPDARSHRIPLADLAREEVRKRLAAVWTEPLSLDPARRQAKVTRSVADWLAALAKSFEGAGHHPEVVAEFLMRCIFTFFAEDTCGRLSDRSRTCYLKSVADQNVTLQDLRHEDAAKSGCADIPRGARRSGPEAPRRHRPFTGRVGPLVRTAPHIRRGRRTRRAQPDLKLYARDCGGAPVAGPSTPYAGRDVVDDQSLPQRPPALGVRDDTALGAVSGHHAVLG